MSEVHIEQAFKLLCGCTGALSLMLARKKFSLSKLREARTQLAEAITLLEQLPF